MSHLSHDTPLAPPHAGPRLGLSGLTLVSAFALTLGLSALLVFSLQPLFGKMVLPLLGGAPNVWITAMLFFQAVLLAGYTYAHLTTRIANIRWQLLVHLAVLAVGAQLLPVAVRELGLDGAHPALWLIALMGLSIGLPFFALSASAPLLQSWFARSGHRSAGDPYFLYAASNIGSLLALLGYPFLIEPLLGLREQSLVWSSGYALVVGLTLLCGLAIGRGGGHTTASGNTAVHHAPVTWRQRAWWVALAFAPSSLMLGVTAHITTDIAAAPLLWVLPLSLYLLTFVITFSRRPLLRHEWMVRAQPYALVLALIFPATILNVWLSLATSLIAVFFFAAMVCHGELVRRRPAASHLTEFYLWMSFGGVLGGLFNALLAPNLFPGIYEYGIAIVICCLLRPGPKTSRPGEQLRDLLLPALLLAIIVGPYLLFGFDPKTIDPKLYLACLALVYIVAFGFKNRPLRFGLAIGAVLLGSGLLPGPNKQLDQRRSFFGVYKVVSQTSADHTAILLFHGSTFHGVQYREAAMRGDPLAYYSRPSPIGQVFATLEIERYPTRVGVVGLGIGTLLAYRKPDQDWRLYEIDPLIGEIAVDGAYFHYMAQAGMSHERSIVYGDARLALAAEQERRFDLLVIDAFTSDAIPIHLLTLEALTLYRDRLADEGVLMIHISNRHLELTRVLAPIVERLGLSAVIQGHAPGQNQLDASAGPTEFHFPSNWVAIARNPETLAPIAQDPRWKRLTSNGKPVLWTDDYSNILSTLR